MGLAKSRSVSAPCYLPCQICSRRSDIPVNVARKLEPLRDAVRRRAHDGGRFAVERFEQLLLRTQLIGISPQTIDSADGFAKFLECFEPLFKRPRPPQFQLGNEQLLEKVLGPKL